MHSFSPKIVSLIIEGVTYTIEFKTLAILRCSDGMEVNRERTLDVRHLDYLCPVSYDAKTAALWHFDEPSGTRKFSDASGHAHHLVGEGGARTGIPLTVEPHGKLTTTWGRLK